MAWPAELDDLLAARASPVRIWWRDDDAGRDNARLEELLALSTTHQVPLTLAVVPEWLEPAAAARMTAIRGVTVFQHGIAHADHASAGQRKIELGGTADPHRLADALERHRERLALIFRGQFRSVLVPPWNRLDAALLSLLPAHGFIGWSGWRGGPPTDLRLRRLDAHLDAIDWRGGRRCRQPEELGRDLAWLLAGAAPEPLGLLTHHLVTNAEGFRSLDQFLGLVQDHPMLRLESAASFFPEAT